MTSGNGATILRVVAAVADKAKCVLYLEDGNTKIIEQGDHRLAALLDQIIPITSRGEVAVVNLADFSLYSDFSQKTGGVVRFFKTARNRLGSLIGSPKNQEVVVINMEFTSDIKPAQLTNLLSEVESHVLPFIDKMEPQETETAQKPSQEDQGYRGPDAFQHAKVGDYVRVEGHDLHTDGWYEVTQIFAREDSLMRLQVRTLKGNFWIVNDFVKALKYAKPLDLPENQPIIAAVDMKVGTGENAVVETIVERLEPVTKDEDVKPGETVLALIGDIIIPDVDKLRPLIAHALKGNSEQSVVNFLKRAAAIIKQRSHSVVDLMRFLERGDLPLAEDGSIVAYKILRNKRDQKGAYVDCHSGKVTQRVGSYVCVDESLVDPNRRNECSNGLHIARRGYLGSFPGDVCTLVKIDPEDVMVVPHNDPNKVRVKGYHILATLSDVAFQKLKNNLPMTEEDEARRRVLEAITGNHVDRVEEVKIHGQMGENVVVTPLEPKKKKPLKRDEISDADSRKASAVDDPKHGLGAINPKEINKRLAQEYENTGVRPNVANPENTDSEQELNDESKPQENQDNSDPEATEEKGSESSENTADTNSTTNNGLLRPELKEALDLVGTGVSQSEASRRTGVSRRTLDRWLKKLAKDSGTQT